MWLIHLHYWAFYCSIALSVVPGQPLDSPVKEVQGRESCYPEDTAQDRLEIEEQIHHMLQGLTAAGLIGSGSGSGSDSGNGSGSGP